MSKHLRWTLGLLLCGGTPAGRLRRAQHVSSIHGRQPSHEWICRPWMTTCCSPRRCCARGPGGRRLRRRRLGESGSRWLWRSWTSCGGFSPGAPGDRPCVDALTRPRKLVAWRRQPHDHPFPARPRSTAGPQDDAARHGLVRLARSSSSGLPRGNSVVVGRVVSTVGAGEVSGGGAWASADSWRPGTRHPGIPLPTIKTGHRPGSGRHAADRHRGAGCSTRTPWPSTGGSPLGVSEGSGSPRCAGRGQTLGAPKRVGRRLDPQRAFGIEQQRRHAVALSLPAARLFADLALGSRRFAVGGRAQRATLGGLHGAQGLPLAQSRGRARFTVCDRRAIFVTSVSPLFSTDALSLAGPTAPGTHGGVVPESVPVAGERRRDRGVGDLHERLVVALGALSVKLWLPTQVMR